MTPSKHKIKQNKHAPIPQRTFDLNDIVSFDLNNPVSKFFISRSVIHYGFSRCKHYGFLAYSY